MSQQHSSLAASPVASLNGIQDGETHIRHDSGTSAQAIEIATLKEELESLRGPKTQTTGKYSLHSHEVKFWRRKAQQETEAAAKHVEDLSEAHKRLSDLETEVKDVRKNTDKQVREAKSQFEKEKKKEWDEQKNTYETEIKNLKNKLDAKERIIKDLHKKASRLERECRRTRVAPKAARGTASPSAMQKNLSGNQKASRFIRSNAPSPEDRIEHLEKENARLTALQKSHVCEELSEAARRQIADAQALQAAAEAETEGLRHIESANVKLTEKHDADSQQIQALIHQLEKYKTKVGKLDSTTTTTTTTAAAAAAAAAADDDDNDNADTETTAPPNLALSAITTGAYTTPIISTQDEKTEIDKLKQDLCATAAAAEEYKSLLSAFTKLSDNYRETMYELDTHIETIHALHAANLTLTATNDELMAHLEFTLERLQAKDQHARKQVAQVKQDLTSEFQARIGGQLQNRWQRGDYCFSRANGNNVASRRRRQQQP
jgi:chromosome segregation ATPase